MKLPDPIELSSGLTAVVTEDPWVAGAIQLVIDGTPQSHVNLRDPAELFFEYVRRIGHVIDLFRDPGAPISALHLGGGAFSLPRYIEATRPGSKQQVIELEPGLVDLVYAAAPLPKRASIRVRRGDAREGLTKLPAGMRGAMDLIVVDVFAGASTPAHIGTSEFYELVRPFLRPDGVVAVNIADGKGMRYARGQAATLRAAFGTVAAIAEPQTFKGRRFGNVVFVAAGEPTPQDRGGKRDRGDALGSAGSALEWLPRLLAGGPHPARMLVGRELDEFIGTTNAVTDATAEDSPAPERDLFDRG